MTFGQLCLLQAPSEATGLDFGRQRVSFRNERDPPPKREAVLNDYQGSTSSHCFSQWHMRFWEDTHINRLIPGYGGPYQYAISGVHHDISTGSFCAMVVARRCVARFGKGHRLSTRRNVWSAYRAYAVHRGMRHLCGRSHYKRRPGMDRDFQGRRFDGWIGIVKYTHDGADERNCPKGLR